MGSQDPRRARVEGGTFNIADPTGENTSSGIRSLFLPKYKNEKSSPSNKIVAAFFGGYMPAPVPLSSIKDNLSSTNEVSNDTNSNVLTSGVANPFANYIFRTSILSDRNTDPTQIVVIVEDGHVLIYDLNDHTKGPYIKHHVDPPNSLLISDNNNNNNNSSGVVVTCASMICSEISITRFRDEVSFDVVPLEGRKPFGATLRECKAIDMEGEAHLALIAQSIQSTPTSNDIPTNKLTQDFYNKYSYDSWKQMVINDMWHGVIGTSKGDVMVFNGNHYVYSFSVNAASKAPLLQAHAVMLPDSDLFDEFCDPALRKVQRSMQRNSKGKWCVCHANSHHEPLLMSYGSPKVAVDFSDKECSSMTSLDPQSGPSYIINHPCLVGFTTFQADGSIITWRRTIKSLSHVLQTPRIDIMVTPYIIVQSKVFSKINVMCVSHQYLSPMQLSCYGPWLCKGAADDFGLQFGRPCSQDNNSPNIVEYTIGNINTNGHDDLYTPAETDFPSWIFPRDTLSSPFHSVSLFSETQRSIRPPMYSSITHGGPGYSSAIHVKGVDGRPLEELRLPDEMVKTTTAIAVEGNHALVARGKILFNINYHMKETRRIWVSKSPIRNIVLNRPMGIAACHNGDIHVFGSELGAPLAFYRTFNSSVGRCLDFHYQAMLFLIVDDECRACEVVSLPDSLLRFSHLPSEKMTLKQGVVIAETLALQEGIRDARRAAVEGRVLAQMAVPSCVEKYLGPQHKPL